jgi:signal transduction histidine kinase
MSRRGVFLALLALAVGLVVALVVAREGRESTLQGILGVGIGWSFVASGLVAWARRPENSIGRFMVLAGFVRLGAEFSTGSDDRVLFLVGHVLVVGFWIAIAYVLLVFPGGRLEGAPSRWILIGAGFLLPLRLGWLLLGGDDDTRNVLVTVTKSSHLTRALELAESGLVLVLGTLVIAVLVRRWQRASPRLRVAFAPVLWAGAAGSILHVLWVADNSLGNPLGEIPMVLHDLVLAGISVGFLVGLLRARLARSAVADLIVEMGEANKAVQPEDPAYCLQCEASAPDVLRDSLARALHDPSLELAFWLEDADRYVDALGQPVELPDEDGTRAVTMIERAGRRIAALVHDPALREDQHLVDSACAAAALEIENQRLQAELRAQLEEVEASRARIVEAGQEERRRIERDLHDGTQQRLVSIAMTLGLADSKLSSDPARAGMLVKEAKGHLSEALEELRDLSQGIHPGILTERGLPAALAELVQRVHMPIVLDVSLTERLPDRVEEAAYYVVSEALTNVVKYAHASKGHIQVERWNGVARVRVSDDGMGGAEATRGSGLRGLRDRVEALGGQLSIVSPHAEGTVLEAEIPCA